MEREGLFRAGFLALMLVSLASSEQICGRMPSLKGIPQLNQENGHVTVVALLQASWSYCVEQASHLEALRQKFARHGYDDLSFNGINSKQWHAQPLKNLLEERVSFPVYQASLENDAFQQLGGSKDDMFIYDRCGRLAYHIPYPKSYTRYGFVESAILSTLLDEPCGPCNQTLEEPQQELSGESQPCLNDTLTRPIEQDILQPSLHPSKAACSWRSLERDRNSAFVRRLNHLCHNFSFNKWKNLTPRKRPHTCCLLAKDLLDDRCMFTMLNEQVENESLYNCRCVNNTEGDVEDNNCVCHESTGLTYELPHRSCLCENFRPEVMSNSWQCAPAASAEEPTSCLWQFDQQTLEDSCMCRPDFPCSSAPTHKWSCESGASEDAASDALLQENAVMAKPAYRHHSVRSCQCEWPEQYPLMQLHLLKWPHPETVITPAPSCTCCKTAGGGSDEVSCQCSNPEQVSALQEWQCHKEHICAEGSWQCRCQNEVTGPVLVWGEEWEAAARVALQSLPKSLSKSDCAWETGASQWQWQSSASWQWQKVSSFEISWQWHGSQIRDTSWSCSDTMLSSTAWQCDGSGAPGSCVWQEEVSAVDVSWEWDSEVLTEEADVTCHWPEDSANQASEWQCTAPSSVWSWSDSQQDSLGMANRPSDWSWPESGAFAAVWECSDSTSGSLSRPWRWHGTEQTLSRWFWSQTSNGSVWLWQVGSNSRMQQSVN